MSRSIWFLDLILGASESWKKKIFLAVSLLSNLLVTGCGQRECISWWNDRQKRKSGNYIFLGWFHVEKLVICAHNKLYEVAKLPALFLRTSYKPGKDCGIGTLNHHHIVKIIYELIFSTSCVIWKMFRFRLILASSAFIPANDLQHWGTHRVYCRTSN